MSQVTLKGTPFAVLGQFPQVGETARISVWSAAT